MDYDKIYQNTPHEHKLMGAIIVSLLIFIGVFNLWPMSPMDKDRPQMIYDENAIITETVINTRQDEQRAAPPKPQTPIPVPNDRVIEEEIEFPEFEDLIFENAIEEGSQLGTKGNQGVVGKPQIPPNIVRIVEPEIPEEARKKKLKAEIYVTFLVDRQGNVEEAYISEIRLYDGEDYEVVQQIGYGLMEATLESATKWKFTPARNEGEDVKTYSTQVFSFGF